MKKKWNSFTCRLPLTRSFFFIVILAVGFLIASLGKSGVLANWGASKPGDTVTHFANKIVEAVSVAKTPTRITKRNNPWINLQDGRNLKVVESDEINTKSEQKQAQPLSLVSADINQDSFPDLICAYAVPNGGLIDVHLGNAEAFSPKEQETISNISKGNFPDPFLTKSIVIRTPEAADFLATGDFNQDGRLDIITAARGSNSIYLLVGDVNHNFAAPRSVSMPGQLTALSVSSNLDGIQEVAVGITGSQGPAVLIYSGATGASLNKPVPYPLPAPATTLAFGQLDDDFVRDLAVVAGDEVFIIHGQGHKNASRYEEGFEEAIARIEGVKLPFAVKTLALGDFIWDRESRQELAVLAASGRVHLVARGELDQRPFTADEMQARRRGKVVKQTQQETSLELKMRRAVNSPRWKVIEDISTALSFSAADLSGGVLQNARISGLPSDDLVIMNPGSRKLQVLSKAASQERKEFSPQAIERVAVEMETDGSPVAVVPMRLNVLGKSSLAMLRAGRVEPVIIMAAPLASFVVSKTADTNDGTCNADCSLREAVVAANAAPGSMITFASGLNGSPIQLTRTGDDNTAANGDLDINADVTIMGNGEANTIIQGSNDANFTSNMGDKIFGINQDGTHTTLNVTISGLTVRFTRNDIAVSATFTQTGGAMDIFLTGGGAVPGPTTTVTNCTFDSNAVAHSYGGGINIDSGAGAVGTGIYRGTVQFTGCTISNNKTLSTSLADNPPAGGGLNLYGDKHNVTFTNCSITGNQTSLDVRANGGGINIRQSNGGTVTLNNTAVNNNTAGSDGGGIITVFVQIVNMTGGSITGNTALGSGVNSMVAESADGGGFFSASNVGVSTTLTGVTISNNVATAGTSARGGGVEDISNSPLNLTNCTISGNSSDSGGGVATTATGTNQTTTITGCTISGNSAATGAGLFVSAGIMSVNTSLANASAISGNTASASGGAIAVTGATGSATIANTTISGNSATTSGGALFISDGTMNVSLSRIVSNTAPTGSGIARTGGTATVENNWWGCDGFPNATGCQTGSGTFDADPRIDLRLTASPTSVLLGGTSTLTADVTKNTDGNNTNGGNAPSVLVGLNLIFDGSTKGTINTPLTVTIPTNGMVTKTFTANTNSATCGPAMPSVTLDNGTQPVTIQVQCPDLTAAKTNNVSNAAVVGQTWNWTVTVTNGGDASGTFPMGSTIFTDNLPNSANISYGSPTPSIAGVSCSINGSKDLTCTATSPVTLAAGGGNFNVQFTATASPPGTATGTYSNPRGGGMASVDPNDSVVESNEGNNAIAPNSVVVSKANTTTTITNAATLSSTSSKVGESYAVDASVTATSPGNGTPTGTITVSDGTDSCTITLPGTSCNLTSTTRGAKTITATYNNDVNFNGSSVTASHNVFAPPTVSKFFVNPAQGNSNNTSLNGTARLAIAITNPPGNPGSLNGLAITDTFPAGLEVASPVVTSNTCGGTFAPSAGATSISFSGGGPLTPGNQCTIFVVVKATTVGAIVNTTGNISSTEGGDGTTASGTLNVFAPPTIAKAFGASIVSPNTPTTMTFTVTNPAGNPGNLTSVGFNDTLMSGLQIAPTPNLVVSNCGSPTTTGFTAGSTALMVSGATVATANACTITVNVIGTTPGTINNTTTAISSGNGGTGSTSNTAQLTVAAPPTLSKAFSPGLITPGGTSTLTVTLNNPNASLALTGATLTDMLPSGVTTLAGTAATTCGGSATQMTNSVSLSGGTIPQGGSCTLSVNVTSATNNTYTNTINAGDLTTSNSGPNANPASATLTVANPPTISKAFSPNSITSGGTSTLTITLTNPNSNVPLTLSSPLTDTLPGTISTLPSTAANTCGGTASQTSGSVTLTGGTIPTNGSCTLTVDVTSTNAGGNTNTIPANALMTNGGSNASPALASLVVGSAPQVIKTFSPTAIKTGATTTMTIAITNNNGAMAFNGVDYTDTLPSGLTVPDAAATSACGGTLTVASNVITLTGATIAAGQTCTTTFTATGATVGVKNNTVTVNTTNFGIGYIGSGTVTVYDVPTISKSFSPTSVPFGGTSTMSFTLTNPNSFAGGDLSGLSFTDTLPSGITVTSGSAAVCGGTLTRTAPNMVSFTGGTLGTSGPGNSCTISVNVTGAQLGMHTNTVSSLTSTETGTNTVNASATLTVNQSPTTTTITNAATLASTPTVVGQSYAVNVTVAPSMGGMGTPSGTVNVSDGTGATCAITLSGGSGSCNLTSTTVGAPKTISAVYAGDTNFATSSTTASHTVNKADTTTTITNTSALATATVVGESYAVNWTVTVDSPGAVGAALTGNVTVSDGSQTCTAAVSAGTCMLTSTTASAKTITATYAGDTNYNGSTASGVLHTVNPANTTVAITNDTPDPSVIGENYAVTAAVSVSSPGGGTPTGTISVTDGTNNCTITLPGTSCNLPSTSVGAKTLTATYSGDSNYNGSGPSTGVPHTVNKADATVTITSDNPDSSQVGQNVTVAFTVAAAPPGAGTPTGTVTVTVSGGSETCTGSLAAGSGSCTLALTVAGSRTLTATYNGDTNFNTGTDTEPHTVVAPPTIAKSFSPSSVPVGQVSTLTVTITNPAANTVALTGVGFTDNFPANVTLVNPANATNTCGGSLTDSGGGSLTTGDTGIKLTGGTVGTSSPRTCTITVEVSPSAQGPHTNTISSVSSTNGGTDSTGTSATLATNTPPTITPQAVARTQGSVGANVVIATASDTEDAVNTLQLQISDGGVTFGNSATVNGVTITLTDSNGAAAGTNPNASGQVLATISTSSTATTASFTLKVTDSGGLSDTKTLTITVIPFTAAISDPFACNGAGGTVTVTAFLTNPDNTLHSASFAVTLPTELNVVNNSCTSTTGSCATTLPKQINWSGTLLANETVQIQYQAQIVNGVLPGQLLTIDSLGIVNGLQVTTSASATVSCPADSLTNPPVNVALSDQKAGSLLVFPYYTSDASGNFTQADTLFEITNVSNSAATLANGAPNYQYLHLFFINKDCSPADTFICLTPGGSLQFKASEFDPLTTGYLIAVAVDEQGRPTQNNAFIGAAYVRNDQAGLIDSYGAESFWKHSTGAVPTNTDGSATVYFDGVNYDLVPIQFSTPLQDPNRATQTLVLASLSGDLGTKLNSTSQNLTGAIYRDDEALASFTNGLGSGCLIERGLTSTNIRLTPSTLTGFLKDRFGYLKFNLSSPAVGLILSKQGSSANYPNLRFAGIRTLHKTAVISSSLKLPIFAPFCQ